MIITKLELVNYRNYSYQDIEFSPDRNIIYGRNAQGKSNLLEAVYFLSHLKSKRTSRQSDLVKEGEKESMVRGFFEGAESGIKIKVSLGRKGREVEVNGRRSESAVKVKGLVKCVLFTPDDLYMVRADPSRRREFLEETAEEKGPIDAEAIHRYRHALKQRNAILRSWDGMGSRLEALLGPWDVELVKWGAKVVNARVEMVGWMENVVSEIYGEASGDSAEVIFRYDGSFENNGELSVEETAETMSEALKRSISEEKKARCTLVGPHRDDVEIRLGGREARFAASQGEQRTMAFSMRLAQRRFIEEVTGEKPVMLLDDVLSELDEGRREKVVRIAGEGSQAIITTADYEGVRDRKGATVYRVDGGEIRVV